MSKLIKVELTRAEKLTKEERQKYNLPNEGLVVHEYWDDKEKLIPGTPGKRFSKLLKEAHL